MLSIVATWLSVMFRLPRNITPLVLVPLTEPSVPGPPPLTSPMSRSPPTPPLSPPPSYIYPPPVDPPCLLAAPSYIPAGPRTPRPRPRSAHALSSPTVSFPPAPESIKPLNTSHGMVICPPAPLSVAPDMVHTLGCIHNQHNDLWPSCSLKNHMVNLCPLS